VAQFDPRKGNTKVWLMQYAYHRAINRRQHLEGREFYRNTELEEEVEPRPVEARARYGSPLRYAEEGDRVGLLRRPFHAGNRGADRRIIR
jgi:hypothetical protein